MAADRDITVAAATEQHTETFDQTKKKSGVFGGGGVSGFGGIGITAGSQKGSVSTSLEQTTSSASMIGSVEGNVTVIAGGDVTVSGSDLLAGRAANDVVGVGGNIAIQGKNVTINPAEETESYSANQSSRSKGLSVAITGTPIDTLRNLQQVKDSDGSGADKASGYAKELGAAALTLPGINVGYGSSKSQGSVAVETTTQRGSSLNAAGNVTVRATEGDITVAGSSIAAGGTATLDAQRHVMLLTSVDTQSDVRNSSSSTHQYGASSISPGDMIRHVQGGPNSGGVRMSPYNSGNSEGNSNQQVIGQTGSTINADKINLVSREGDITLQGAQVAAENALNVSAQKGNVELLPGEISRSWQETQRSKQIGDLGGDGYTGSTGVRNELHDVNGRQTDQNSVRTSLSSNQGDVNIVAQGDVIARGADISAGNDVTLVGANVVLDAATDTLTQAERHRVNQAGGTIALSGYGVQAAQAAEAAQRANEAGDDRLAALYAAQAGYAAKDAMQGTGAAVKVTVSVGSSSASSNSTLQQSTEQGSTVTAGRNVNVIATGDGTRGADGYAATGDITVRGGQITAGNNASFDAARDINFLSSQNTQTQEGNSKSGSGSVGVGFGLGGSQNGFTIEIAASAAQGQMQGNGTTHQATQVQAGNQLSLTSGRDTTLQGAQAMGETVLADIGRNLTLSSSQDNQYYDQKDQNAGFGVSLCIPPLCFGASSGSVSYGQTDINNNYNSTTQQTGIAAGAGGYQIHVGNHTQLDGAVIASTADPTKNLLSTESLGVTDLSNHANYSGGSWSGSAAFSGSIGDQSAGGANSGAPTESYWNRPGGNVSPGMSRSDSASSQTRSDISAGTVVIRNGDTTALAGLDRTATELQQEGLQNKFDAGKIQSSIEAGRIAGEVGFRAAGDVAAKYGWDEGSPERTLLHGAVGAAMASLGGGSAMDGLGGAVANQLAFKAMYSFITNTMGLDPNDPLVAELMQAGSAAVGMAAGGQTGSAVALSATQNNWLKHAEYEQLKEAEEACGPSDPGACAVAQQLRALDASRNAEYAEYVSKVRAEADEKGITLDLEEFDRQTRGYWNSYGITERDAVRPGEVFSRTYPTGGQDFISALKVQSQILQFINGQVGWNWLPDGTPIAIPLLEGAGDTWGSWWSGTNYFTGESLDPNQQRDGKILSLANLLMPGGLLTQGVKGGAQQAVKNELKHELQEEAAKGVAGTLRLAKPDYAVPKGYTVSVGADGAATVTGPFGGIYKSTGKYDANGRQIYSDASGKYFTLEGGRNATPSPNQNVGKENATKGQQSDADVGKDLDGTGARPQVAYKDGKEVSPNTPESVRPDWCIGEICSIEVKNYNLATNSGGLIRDVTRQALDRAVHLPEGMEQLLVIDIRGQKVTPAQRAAIVKAISENTGGVIKAPSIQFKE